MAKALAVRSVVFISNSMWDRLVAHLSHSVADSGLRLVVGNLSGRRVYGVSMKKIALLILAPLALSPLQVLGQDTVFPDFEIAEEAVRRGEILPLATIMEHVAAVQPGRVIEVELEMEDGIRVYEVELITPDGRLLEVDLDARTVAILSLDEDN